MRVTLLLAAGLIGLAGGAQASPRGRTPYSTSNGKARGGNGVNTMASSAAAGERARHTASVTNVGGYGAAYGDAASFNRPSSSGFGTNIGATGIKSLELGGTGSVFPNGASMKNNGLELKDKLPSANSLAGAAGGMGGGGGSGGGGLGSALRFDGANSNCPGYGKPLCADGLRLIWAENCQYRCAAPDEGKGQKSDQSAAGEERRFMARR